MSDFSIKLLQWRIGNSYTQEKLADICNLSVRTIQSWENGTRLPGFDSLISIASVMGVSIDWLCGRSKYWQSIDSWINPNIV